MKTSSLAILKLYNTVAFLYLVRFLSCMVLLLLSRTVFAISLGQSTMQAEAIRYGISSEENQELMLIVDKQELIKVLNLISVQSRVPLHHSGLEGQTVTAKCVGANIKVILNCLMGEQGNIVYRYRFGDKKQILPVEIRLLHADISANKATFDPPRKSQQLVTANSTNIDEESNRDKQSHEKAQMIAGLANVGPQADIKLIKQALMDESPEVRAQAVFALAKTAGDTALSEMRLALHDENPEVRMMVVDNVDNNLNLLTEATEDEDPQVRQMAISKLALLNKSGGY